MLIPRFAVCCARSRVPARAGLDAIPVKSFNQVTETGLGWVIYLVTEQPRRFGLMLRLICSAGVAPERRSKADATGWLRYGSAQSPRAKTRGFCFGPHPDGEAPSRGLGHKARRRRAVVARLSLRVLSHHPPHPDLGGGAANTNFPATAFGFGRSALGLAEIE
jgi:hypothetical protein